MFFQTAGHCSFLQLLLKQEEIAHLIAHLLGTIFSGG